LIVTEPQGGTELRAELKSFYDDATWKNRLAYLTETKNTYDALIDVGKRLKAIQHIVGELKNDKLPDNDPQMIQATELSDKTQQNFHSVVRETFTTLWYPTDTGLTSTDLSMKFEGTRDDDSGEVVLRITPTHGDTIYWEVGGAASTSSEKLSGNQLKIKELRVSILAVDSQGVHEPGDPVIWTNRITLKNRIYQSGKDKMCELRAAPPAQIKYTTDGSDPKVAGATYEGAFVVPRGAPMILAYADRDGIHSSVERVNISWDKEEDSQGRCRTAGHLEAEACHRQHESDLRVAGTSAEVQVYRGRPDGHHRRRVGRKRMD
jgi:hypothetical protein